jgi:hypothetical protein
MAKCRRITMNLYKYKYEILIYTDFILVLFKSFKNDILFHFYIHEHTNLKIQFKKQPNSSSYNNLYNYMFL